MELAPLLVFFRYDDMPGVIGRVGTLFGEAGVNIANMAVSRTRRGGKALMALSIDSEAPRELVERSTARASTMRDSFRWSRGGSWVIAQLVLFALIIGSWFFGPGVTRLGFVVALVGAVILGAAMRAMGHSLTALPVPQA